RCCLRLYFLWPELLLFQQILNTPLMQQPLPWLRLKYFLKINCVGTSDFSPNFIMVHFSCLSCCTSGWSDSISVPRLQKIKKITLTDFFICIMNHGFSNTKKN